MFCTWNILSINWLVEYSSFTEHPQHALHHGDIHPPIGWLNAPARKITTSMFCTLETSHPPINWLGMLGMHEHPKICRACSPPWRHPNLLVECYSITKHPLHVPHIRDIPSSHALVENPHLIKKSSHTCYAGHAPMGPMQPGPGPIVHACPLPQHHVRRFRYLYPL